ncbi:UDP-glucose:undecaprenyl-phosphate glucose-1-phosphate transferase [Rubripirellula obstinata]|uniref:UDP-glucose:undecaprenyl-phosphate glucose-1-phosphate transferase n=1 Tax=Rubripirellula obstinata TaxID=406547 RepID=A0A5B1CIL9_9BACT|nr:undecaprenyl-phosphate glucose phosphotransferase [Rubripirellula obstinata]KAA1260102.1 UDP-glucose:undecaprenyl-phosphate glucose-1-phosphate transferase [Rubripirellula obstinata]
MISQAPIITQRRWLDVLQPALDAAGVLASLAIVKWISRGVVEEMALAMGLIAVIVFLLMSQLTGFHRRPDVGSADREMTTLAATWSMTILVLALLAFATRYGQHFARSVMMGWIALAPCLIGLGRMSMRIVQGGLMKRGIGVRKLAIAGLNDLGRQTAANIEQDPSIGLQLVGFYDDRSILRDSGASDSSAKDSSNSTAIALHGNLVELVEQARNGEIDTVLITLPMRAEDRIRYLLDQLSDSTVSVYIVPDFFVFELLHSQWTSMGGLPAVSVFENPLFGVDGMVKRVSDVVLASIALVASAIPMLLIAIAVKASSPGPVFFRQRRYGLDGREILVWKFRSMRTCDNGPVVKQATTDDPRITHVGAILRRTSLDEIPQIFNVLQGSMSLVGPRPHASAHNEQYRSLIRGYMLRHKVKPGITGLAQVNGCRGETETLDKMQARINWDHRYIRSWSLWSDIKIMFRTVFVVLKQDQAH